MSELTKEKIYKRELIAGGATGNNNLERIRSLAGGGVSNKSFFMKELDLKLPEKLSFVKACGNGDCVYIYGGTTESGYGFEDYYRINTKTNETTLLESGFCDIGSATLVYAYGYVWVFGGNNYAGYSNSIIYALTTNIGNNQKNEVVQNATLGNSPLVIHKGNAFYIIQKNKQYRLVVDERNVLENAVFEEISDTTYSWNDYAFIFEDNESYYSSAFIIGGTVAGGDYSKRKYNLAVYDDSEGKPNLYKITDFTLSGFNNVSMGFKVVWGKQNNKYVLIDFDKKTYYKCIFDDNKTFVIEESQEIDEKNSKLLNDLPSAGLCVVSLESGIYCLGGARNSDIKTDAIYKITIN